MLDLLDIISEFDNEAGHIHGEIPSLENSLLVEDSKVKKLDQQAGLMFGSKIQPGGKLFSDEIFASATDKERLLAEFRSKLRTKQRLYLVGGKNTPFPAEVDIVYLKPVSEILVKVVNLEQSKREQRQKKADDRIGS